MCRATRLRHSASRMARSSSLQSPFSSRLRPASSMISSPQKNIMSLMSSSYCSRTQSSLRVAGACGLNFRAAGLFLARRVVFAAVGEQNLDNLARTFELNAGKFAEPDDLILLDAASGSVNAAPDGLHPRLRPDDARRNNHRPATGWCTQVSLRGDPFSTRFVHGNV